MLLWYRCGILPWTLKPCQKAVIRKDKKNSYTNSLHPSGLNILNTFELSWKPVSFRLDVTFGRSDILKLFRDSMWRVSWWNLWCLLRCLLCDVGEVFALLCLQCLQCLHIATYCNILEPWQCILQSSIARQENKLCACWDAQKPTHFLTSACRSCAHAKHAKHAKDWLNVKMTAHPDASG